MKECWVIGVSGGPDSMALLNYVKDKYHCVVAHVNYQMRQSSDRDQKIVEEFCLTHCIKYEYRNFPRESHSGNFQSQARNFRYDFYKELVEKYKANGVILGHHLDDDLETYVWQRERKLMSEFIGLRETTKIKRMTVYRPLLKWTKDNILDYCLKHKIPYGIDESNFETNYSRNKIRYKLSQLKSHEKAQLIEKMYLEKQLRDEQIQRVNNIVNLWEKSFSINDYAKVSNDDRLWVLREFLGNNGVNSYLMSRKYLKEIDRNILEGKADYYFKDLYLSTSYGCCYLVRQKNFQYVLDRMQNFVCDEFEISLRGQRDQGFYVSQTDFPITIRNIRPGDFIEKSFGRKKLSRFLIDHKVPRAFRNNWPVVENKQGKIIYSPGLGSCTYYSSNNPRLFMVKYMVSWEE